MLHSRLLRYLDEVARSGSIRAAGEKLHIAPSAINKHLLQLEEEIGEQLFERLPRGLRLTAAGEILLAHVRRTMLEYRQVEAEIRDLKTMAKGEVIIATLTGLASGIASAAAASFGAQHPHIKITIRVMFMREIHDALVNGDADLGLSFNLPPSPQLECLWEMDTTLGAVLAPMHPLARMESVPLAYCTPYPLIFADRSMLMHGIVADTFAEAGLPCEPAFSTNSIETMKRLAANGDGIAFLSKFDIAEEYRQETLVYRQIRDRAFSKNVLSLVRRAKREHGLASLLLAEEIMGVLRATSGG
ncbi:DNA-binding transcriptional LysR family regulator [Herbaspirillum sp. Sphag1AN]|uniref:LysR family transcriptional regulator n=1 Tax=unclassified Herbaspirillum TaxID=2624150 RepID=UPI0016120510|nr:MULTISPECIES: LysR family transcriptional regulator [unclassified Herbaspirillum]MBB3211641.1 DNA-binding transcriptional LysR family regulator [Herbaspirillum sp. Sphag1AN]MBB3245091.1 DNA-binding transcriptional LysR family regulator [Herbaspirillum sp. Sphag64]